MPRKARKYLVCCFLGSIVVGIFVPVTPIAIAGSHLPDEWISDYDYREDLAAYLKRQYEAAVRRHRVPYMYLYADWCTPCIAFRDRVKKKPEFAKLFAGTQIIAVDFDGLKHVTNKPAYLTLGAPLIIPMESDGSLGEPIVDGIPWERRVPNNIDVVLCSYFAARSIPGVVVDRGCQP